MNAVFSSLRRGSDRIFILLIFGVMFLGSSFIIPLVLGPTLAPLFFGFGLTFLGLAAGDVALRILQPDVDAQKSARAAQARDGGLGDNIGAGLVYLGRCILSAAILMLIVTAARAAEPPAAAVPLLPILKDEQRAWWPDMPLPSALGAQIEQETCITLKHPRCWSPRAELRTARERGVGLGQITRTARFDSLEEMRAQFPRALGAWSWDTASLYDPRMQMRGLILMNLRNWRAITGVPDPIDRLAMTFATYNGGFGGLSSDRRACAGTPGCDPGRWWDHVERTSLKSKTAVAGYGRSFFVINREYPVNVMLVRRVRYLALDA